MADVAQGYRDLAGTLQGFFDRTREDRRLAANLGMEKAKLENQFQRQAVEDAWNAKLREAQGGEIEEKIRQAKIANEVVPVNLTDILPDTEAVDWLALGDGGKNWDFTTSIINQFDNGKLAGSRFSNVDGRMVLSGKDGKPVMLPRHQAARLYQDITHGVSFVADPARLIGDRIAAMKSGAIPSDPAKLAKWESLLSDKPGLYLDYADKLVSIRDGIKRNNPYIDTKEYDARIDRLLGKAEKEAEYLREDSQAAKKFEMEKSLIQMRIGGEKDLAKFKAGIEGAGSLKDMFKPNEWITLNRDAEKFASEVAESKYPADAVTGKRDAAAQLGYDQTKNSTINEYINRVISMRLGNFGALGGGQEGIVGGEEGVGPQIQVNALLEMQPERILSLPVEQQREAAKTLDALVKKGYPAAIDLQERTREKAKMREDLLAKEANTANDRALGIRGLFPWQTANPDRLLDVLQNPTGTGPTVLRSGR